MVRRLRNHLYLLLGLDVAIEARLADVAEGYLAGCECKQRVVLTDADVLASFDLRTALSHNDFAGLDRLTVSAFDAEIFWLRIAQVPGATTSFLM